MADNRAIIGVGLLGLAAGVTLALLFTPRSGKANRAMVKENADKAMEWGKEMRDETIPHMRAQAMEKAGMVREKMSSLVHHDGQKNASVG
jgi:gas vesicle protein